MGVKNAAATLPPSNQRAANAGILRINLPSYGADDELDDISRGEFFAQVEEKQWRSCIKIAIKPDTSAASIKWSGAIRKRHLVRSRIRVRRIVDKEFDFHCGTVGAHRIQCMRA